MLRIDQRTDGDTLVVKVDGRVVGPWAAELRRVLRSVPREAAVELELAGVDYVDSDGEDVLRDAAEAGVHIREPSRYVAALLERDAAGDAERVGDRPTVDAILAGDEAAFLGMVDRHYGSMLLLARCFVAREADARTVVHAAFGEGLDALPAWDDREPLRVWLLRATARLARDGSAGPATSGPPGRADGRDGRVAALRNAIEILPPLERAVMTLRDVLGCTGADAAAALGISEAHERVLLGRARAQVLASVEPDVLSAA